MPPTQAAHPSWLWDKPPASPKPASEDSLPDSLIGSSDSPTPPAAPTNIRFPPNGFKSPSVLDYACRWTDCQINFNSSTALIEHLQVKHVNSQCLGEYYVCLWTECKVYSRKSCSRTWLERHVLSHGGNKPYRCIVDGCGQRFSSQNLLQRHVNSHFGDSGSQSSAKKGCEISNKLIRRNGKKLRYRRHPFSARAYDYFDAGIMEGVQHKLIEVTERRTLGRIDSSSGHTVTLHSKVICKRLDPNGQSKLLLRWFPRDILDDEWVESACAAKTREVSIPSLSTGSKDRLFDVLSNSLTSGCSRLRSTGRKPSNPS